MPLSSSLASRVRSPCLPQPTPRLAGLRPALLLPALGSLMLLASPCAAQLTTLGPQLLSPLDKHARHLDDLHPLDARQVTIRMDHFERGAALDPGGGPQVLHTVIERLTLDEQGRASSFERQATYRGRALRPEDRIGPPPASWRYRYEPDGAGFTVTDAQDKPIALSRYDARGLLVLWAAVAPYHEHQRIALQHDALGRIVRIERCRPAQDVATAPCGTSPPVIELRHYQGDSQRLAELVRTQGDLPPGMPARSWSESREQARFDVQGRLAEMVVQRPDPRGRDRLQRLVFAYAPDGLSRTVEVFERRLAKPTTRPCAPGNALDTDCGPLADTTPTLEAERLAETRIDRVARADGFVSRDESGKPIPVVLQAATVATGCPSCVAARGTGASAASESTASRSSVPRALALQASLALLRLAALPRGATQTVEVQHDDKGRWVRADAYALKDGAADRDTPVYVQTREIVERGR